MVNGGGGFAQTTPEVKAPEGCESVRGFVLGL
jgi:hypothetical protein